MFRKLRIISFMLTLVLAALGVGTAQAEPAKMSRDGDLLTIEMTGAYNFLAVVDMLQIRLFEQGWEIRDVHDVDLRLRQEGHLVHNKVVTASKPSYFSVTPKMGGRSSLVIPTDILVYEDFDEPMKTYSYRSRPGKITLAFVDPVARARIVGLDDKSHAEKAREELRQAVEETVAFFQAIDE